MDAWVDRGQVEAATRLERKKTFLPPLSALGSLRWKASPSISVLVTWLLSLTLSFTLLSAFSTPRLPAHLSLQGCAWGHFPMLHSWLLEQVSAHSSLPCWHNSLPWVPHGLTHNQSSPHLGRGGYIQLSHRW